MPQLLPTQPPTKHTPQPLSVGQPPPYPDRAASPRQLALPPAVAILIHPIEHAEARALNLHLVPGLLLRQPILMKPI